LSLGIIKIGWDCNNSSCNSFSQIGFWCLFHFHENKSSNLRWGVRLSLSFYPCITTVMLNYLVWKMLDILLDCWIIESSSD
jgi:hypothetical protein